MVRWLTLAWPGRLELELLGRRRSRRGGQCGCNGAGVGLQAGVSGGLLPSAGHWAPDPLRRFSSEPAGSLGIRRLVARKLNRANATSF